MCKFNTTNEQLTQLNICKAIKFSKLLTCVLEGFRPSFKVANKNQSM